YPHVSGALGLGDRALKFVWCCVLEVLKSRLGLSDQCGECLRLMDRHVGKNLAVDLDTGLVQAVDEAAVGQAMLARRSVDALDPQSAEIALPILAIAIGVLQRLLDSLLGNTDRIFAAAIETLGGLQNFLVLGMGGNAPLNTCHCMISLNCTVAAYRP